MDQNARAKDGDKSPSRTEMMYGYKDRYNAHKNALKE